MPRLPLLALLLAAAAMVTHAAADEESVSNTGISHMRLARRARARQDMRRHQREHSGVQGVLQNESHRSEEHERGSSNRSDDSKADGSSRFISLEKGDHHTHPGKALVTQHPQHLRSQHGTQGNFFVHEMPEKPEGQSNCFLLGNDCQRCIAVPKLDEVHNSIIPQETCGFCREGAHEGACVPGNRDGPGGRGIDCTFWVPNGAASSECTAPIPEDLGERGVRSSHIAKFPPETDEDCEFNSLLGQCSPPKFCEYRFEIGDFSMDSSCRMILKKTTHPTTNAECEWSYSRFRCDDSDWCEYKYRAFDLTLSQSCRLIDEPRPKKDSECWWDYSHFQCAYGTSGSGAFGTKDPSVPPACQYMYRLGDITLSQSCRTVVRATPTTDEECWFDFSKWECAHPDVCEHHYTFGDVLPDTQCRLITSRKVYPEPHPKRDEDCEFDYEEMQCAYPGAGDRPISQPYEGNAGVCGYHYLFGDLTLSQSCRLNDMNECPVKPTTDEECDWDYRAFKCECSDVCEYRFELGDLTLDQSCRLQGGPIYDPPAPTGDEECEWDYKRMHCKWPGKCEFNMCLGDVTLSQSCRFKEHWPDGKRTCSMTHHELLNPPTTDAGCEWDYRSGQCKNPSVCKYKYCLGDITLDASCRIDTESVEHVANSAEGNAPVKRTCEVSRHPAETGLSIPRGNSGCRWDYNAGSCIWPGLHCQYHYCFGDLTLDQSCRWIDPSDREVPVRCETSDAEVGAAPQTRSDAAKRLTERLQRLAEARERRQMLLRKSAVEKQSWGQAVEHIEEEDFERKVESAASSYSENLLAVGRKERQMISQMKTGKTNTSEEAAKEEPGGLDEIIQKVGNFTNAGLVLEQTDRRAVEEKCGAHCTNYNGNEMWEDCLQDCLFSL